MTYDAVVIQFPVAVREPDGTLHTPAKVHSAAGRTRAWVWRDGGAALVLDLAAELVRAGFQQWKVDTPAGTYRVSATGNCGCGHPLKVWRLPKPVLA